MGEIEQKKKEETSQKRLKALKRFLKEDVEIKKMMINVAPSSMDDYNAESKMQYIDKLYKEVVDCEKEFSYLFENLGIPQSAMQKFFLDMKNNIARFNENRSVKELYEKCVTSMSPQIVEDAKKKLGAYILLRENDFEMMLGDAKSINEILHIAHMYIMNSDEIMKSMPVISKKSLENGTGVTLYGEIDEVSKKIYDKIPNNIDIGITDIISMNNRTLMMIRDKGHALTIDITKSEDPNSNDRRIEYFIPKVCNIEIARNLPGVKNVNNNNANGAFELSEGELINSLFDFIGKVPTDADIPIYQVEESEFTTIDLETVEGKTDSQENILQESVLNPESYKNERLGFIKQIQSSFVNAIKSKGKTNGGKIDRDR